LSDLPSISLEQQPNLEAVLRLARTVEVEVSHTYRVTQLAVSLFDQLKPVHALGDKERAWLIYAGLLHDIGWIEGWREHHKVSLRIILTTPMLNFSNKERLIIGSIARYHRKSLPDPKHDHYAALNQDERKLVNTLAGCLRLADALDHSHQQKVSALSVRLKSRKIILDCTASQPCPEELEAVEEKKDLLERAFRRKVEVRGLV
jgi:exopolyphosphatase/pppGpp-phosphohydrolase